MKSVLDEGTEPWGVMVERVEVKDVRVPEQLQRAMAAEAEAARNARAKVIAAEGEHKASRSLRQAAEVIMDSPAALQLRYLQTLNSISAEHNSTIIFPVPIDIVSNFMNMNYQQPCEPPPTPQVVGGSAEQYQQFVEFQQQSQHTMQAQHSLGPTSQATTREDLEEKDCSLKHLVGSDLNVT